MLPRALTFGLVKRPFATHNGAFWIGRGSRPAFTSFLLLGQIYSGSQVSCLVLAADQLILPLANAEAKSLARARSQPPTSEAEALEEEQARKAALEKIAANQGNATYELPAEQPLQYFSFGSYSTADQRPLILTVTNRGAGVDRIELVERDEKGAFKYRSLDNRAGYPGYLAFHVVPEGLRISNITAGSPAQVAANIDPSKPDGLRVGDIVIGWLVSQLNRSTSISQR